MDRALAQLLASAEKVDGVPAFNEEAQFAAPAEVIRVERDGELRGAAVNQPSFGTAQLVVHPAHRRQHIGSALLAGLPPDAKLWAFGNLTAARAFAAHHGYHAGRELLQMLRPLRKGEFVPQPFAPFRAGDAAALLDVNARAFAHHPEQGALDEAGLQARMAEPWFRPEDLLLAWEGDTLLGFHWLKRETPGVGEVYVLAVAPEAQGRGLGTRLLEAGLARLAAEGDTSSTLYVEAAEVIPVHLYRQLGFKVITTDVLYEREVDEHV
ncbi:MAG: mycothiol synthase [Propionibacteriaceae bacterium]|jgi:mycothiol synthase|nr:mycothiol synthase [Propionibacteriaceae bacterium]